MNNKLGLASIVLCATLLSAQETQKLVVRPLTEVQLQMEVQNITRLLKSHTYAMYGLSLLAAFHFGTQLHQVYRFFKPKTDSVHELAELNARLELIAKNAELLKIEKNEKKSKDPFYVRYPSAVWNGTKYAAGQLFSKDTALFIGHQILSYNLLVLVSQMQQYFVHPNTINWYIGYDCDYEKLSDGIIASVQQIELEKRDLMQKRVTPRAMLIALCNKLVFSVGRLYGFMDYKINKIDIESVKTNKKIELPLVKNEYKSSTVSAWMSAIDKKYTKNELSLTNLQNKQRKEALSENQRYILNLINSWALEVSKYIANENYSAISIATIQLKGQLKKEIERFSLLDDEEDIIRELMVEIYKG